MFQGAAHGTSSKSNRETTKGSRPTYRLQDTVAALGFTGCKSSLSFQTINSRMSVYCRDFVDVVEMLELLEQLNDMARDYGQTSAEVEHIGP